MSNYVAPAYHPKTGKIVAAEWLDNHFGSHIYGVRFTGDDHVYKGCDCSMEAAAEEIVRIRLELSGLSQRAEAFRVAVLESGALNHVPQSAYFVALRRLEQALEMLGHQQRKDQP